MRSIRTKFLLLVYVTMFGMFILLTGISILFFKKLINRDSTELLTMLVDQKAEELNLHFEGVERSVDTLTDYIRSTLNTDRYETDLAYRDSCMQEIKFHSSDIARVLGEVKSYYVRPEPVKYGSTSGIFMLRDAEGAYISLPPVDILAYSPDDREHVGWYYEPVRAGEPVWMEPYNNRNINVYMISYVTPLVIDGDFFGIVGMDVTMAAVHNVIDSVDYESAFGFLVGEDGCIVYHPDYPSGLNSQFFDEETKTMVDFLFSDEFSSDTVYTYTRHGLDYRLVGSRLENGMILGITIPETDIIKPRVEMMRVMAVVLAVVTLMVLFVSWRLLMHVIRPILEMTDASVHIAKGEFNVPITYHSDNEIGALADSIREMSREMQEYVTYIHEQAYTDAMTGVGNKAAYMDYIKLMDRKIHESMADFAVVVMDINGLKWVNDRLGHEYGDMLIKDVANVVKDVFGDGNVFRIGGDEFIAILEKVTDEEMQEFMKRSVRAFEDFNKKKTRYGTPMAASRGYSVFREGEDQDFRSVFQRADEEMYKDKEKFYQGKNDRRKR